MGANSSIEWTHHTFNIVWGCQRVSPGCQHCYAETLAKRWGHNVWGPAKTTARREMSAAYWQQPYKWNKTAEKAGQRARVFCGSMSDVFEDHPTNEWARANLWGLIDQTPWLDWLLLTKRPENISRMLPATWLDTPQPNIWLGTSVEDQEHADRRIPHLLNIPARVRFLSCEPLLGAVDLVKWITLGGDPLDWMPDGDAPPGEYNPVSRQWETCPDNGGIHWVIAGGESGPGARPMHPDWARSLRDQCQEAGVAYHFKQWGEYRYGEKRAQREADGSVSFHDDGMPLHLRVGKKAAGRLLDGREWNEVPL